MIVDYPVTWQLVVNTHDGAFHLFERDDELPIPPHQGMLVANVEGVPAVAGPDAGFDNIMRRVLYNGATKRAMCQLQGYRAATETLDEVKESLPGWKYIQRLDGVKETGPEDLLS